MIANDECTAPTMLEALAHTLGALQAAGLLDVDRTTDERAFFEAERASLQPVFAAEAMSIMSLSFSLHSLLRQDMKSQLPKID